MTIKNDNNMPGTNSYFTRNSNKSTMNFRMRHLQINKNDLEGYSIIKKVQTQNLKDMTESFHLYEKCIEMRVLTHKVEAHARCVPAFQCSLTKDCIEQKRITGWWKNDTLI
jgi:hypothetical protein